MVTRNVYFNQINNIPQNPTVAQKHGLSVQELQTPDVRKDFASILRENIEKSRGVNFSKHAEYRLQSRGIKLSEDQMEKLAQAVDKAKDKGVRDSLVLIDDLALVVNVKNRMVITVANNSDLKNNIFTNIDGAVIV